MSFHRKYGLGKYGWYSYDKNSDAWTPIAPEAPSYTEIWGPVTPPIETWTPIAPEAPSYIEIWGPITPPVETWTPTVDPDAPWKIDG